METIFGVPWPQVDLDVLTAFLAQADDEGLLREAKGPDPTKPDARFEARHVRESACGFANAVGGFTIIGASRGKDGRWELPGVVVPHQEPETWLDDAIATLSPRPRFEPRAFQLDDDRVAAVVRVEPVAVPPCMTPGGEIYERTAGKTVKVTEPLVLSRLFDDGRNARARAEANADRAASDLRAFIEQGKVNAYLALCAARYDADIASRLFADKTDQEPETLYRLQDIIIAHLKPDRYTTQSGASSIVRQDSLVFITGSGVLVGDTQGGDHRWLVRAAWDGSVGVRCAGNESEIGIDILLEDIVVPAWRAAAAMIPILGGYGPVYLTLKIEMRVDGEFAFHTGPRMGIVNFGGATLNRWLEAPTPTDELVASIRRELVRAAGSPAWEPRASE